MHAQLPLKTLFHSLLLLGLTVTATAQPKGPPYYDPERSLKKQQEAAKEAKTKARSAGAEDAFALLNDVSVWVRDDTFKVLVDRNDAALMKQLAGQLGNRRAPIGAAAVAELFGACKFAPGAKALSKLGLKSRDEHVVLCSIWALEKLRDRSTAKALAGLAKRARSYRVAGDALIALAVVDPSRARPLIKKALESKKLPWRIGALEAQGRIGRHQATQAALTVIKDAKSSKSQRGWSARVLFAGLDAIDGWSKRSADKQLVVNLINALIERLKKAEGLSKYRIAETLQDLTGQSIGVIAEDWASWWKGREEGFSPKDKVKVRAPRKTRKSKKKKKGDDPADAAEKKDKKRKVTGDDPGGTSVRFHGIPIRSNRLLFAQDVSGGMRNAVDKSKPDSPSKLKFANDELRRVLKSLGDDVLTNVCFFATQYVFTAEQLFSIKKARQKLLSFVGEKSVIPTGKAMNRSNLYGTLAKAMMDPEVDTIFFLSEGGPTEGKFLRTPRFMHHLARLNVYQRVQVHCLQVTTSTFGEKFLRRLSDETGGKFYDYDTIKKAHGL